MHIPTTESQNQNKQCYLFLNIGNPLVADALNMIKTYTRNFIKYIYNYKTNKTYKVVLKKFPLYNNYEL